MIRSSLSRRGVCFGELLLSSHGLQFWKLSEATTCNIVPATSCVGGNGCHWVTSHHLSFPFPLIRPFHWVSFDAMKKYWTLGQETDSAHISHEILGRIVNPSETPFFSTTLLPHLAVWRIKLLHYESKWLLRCKYHTRRLLFLLLYSYYGRMVASSL